MMTRSILVIAGTDRKAFQKLYRTMKNSPFHQKGLLVLFLVTILFTLKLSAQKTKQTISQWVFYEQGKLSYKQLPTGDRIMDFSHAGYMGGGVRLPAVEVKITL